jgi:hypothetical protein
MSAAFTCPEGHVWQAPDLGAVQLAGRYTVCPVCGRQAATLTYHDNGEPGSTAALVPDPSGTMAGVAARAAVAGHEILDELGRGGMGVVYRARHLRLNRLVALKMILAGGSADAADLARFEREAESAARLQHPNIVQIYEVGEADGQPFLSLEYVPGGSLARRLDGTPLPARQAAELVQTLARAMAHAHAVGVLHRDLKPANVLLTADGQPKITDFGLAKKLDDPAGPTRSGAILGTPSYMAPEQAAGHGKTIGPAADVYALGAILYEALTGRPPFRAATALETVLQVLSAEPVPPRRLQPGLPRDLETICLKCLEKGPARRYAGAGELADDLGRFLEHCPVRARPVGPWQRAAKWVARRPVVSALAAAVVLVACLGAGLVTWQWRDAVAARRAVEGEQRHTARELRRAETAAYAMQLGLAQSELQAHHFPRARAVLDDCRWDLRDFEFRYLWTLYQRKRAAPCRVLDAHAGAVTGLCWSPDGRQIAGGSADNKVHVWDAATGRALYSLEGYDGHAFGPATSPSLNGLGGLAFSPDGKLLASFTGTVWDVEKRAVRFRWGGRQRVLRAAAGRWGTLAESGVTPRRGASRSCLSSPSP